jgi:hypothetical protein
MNWFKVDNTRMSNAELRRCSENRLAFSVLWLRKLLRWRWRPHYGFCHGGELQILRYENLPRIVRLGLRDDIADAEDFGYRLAVCYCLDCLGDMWGYSATLLHPSGTKWISTCWTCVRRGAVSRKEQGALVASRFADGSVLTTTNLRQRLDAAPEFLAEYCLGESLAELERRHAVRLKEDGRAPVVLDEESLKVVLLSIVNRSAQWQIGRGVYTPMSPAEVARLQKARVRHYFED